MGDGNLQLLMRQRAYRERPRVAVGSDLAVARAEYERGEQVAICLQPRTVGAEGGGLGLYPEATHAVYLAAPAERLEVGERLSVVVAQTALAEDCGPGDSEVLVQDGSGFVAGASVEIAGESRRVSAVTGAVLSLTSGLTQAHDQGASVRMIRHYLVLGSEDEGGQGHHVRVAVREAGG